MVYRSHTDVTVESHETSEQDRWLLDPLLSVIGLFPNNGPPEKMEVSLPVFQDRPAGLFFAVV